MARIPATVFGSSFGGLQARLGFLNALPWI